ncbi:39S ribosomal protein L40, mitochondrial [Sigmodon hispidus]
MATLRCCMLRALRLQSWIPRICQTHPPESFHAVLLGAHPHESRTFTKKKVDPRKDQAAKDRLKKRIRKLEKATQELIPIEDFITPVRFLDKSRQRHQEGQSSEESEQRALLLKR